MAGTSTAYGFFPIRKLDGSPYNGGVVYAYLVEGSQIYAKGDLLAANASATAETGHTRQEVTIGSATDGVTAIGVASHFEYTDTDGNYVMTTYVPAAIAAATGAANRVKVYYYPVLPEIVFQVQAAGGTLAASDIGLNYDIGIGTANATRKLSGHYLDAGTAGATTAATPMRLIGLVDRPGNAWGDADVVTTHVEVVFQSTIYNVGTAGI